MTNLAKAAVAGAILAAALAAALIFSLGRTSQIAAQAPNQMAVTAPSPVTVGNTFLATIAVTAAGEAYDTYQIDLEYPAGLTHTGATDAHLAGASGYVACAGFTGGAAGPVTTFCGRPAGALAFVGNIVQVELQCVSSGVWSLHLVSLDEDPTNGATTIGPAGAIDTDLADGSVNCGGVASPTATATNTPPAVSPTPTNTRTATPTRTVTPTPTSTPLPAACRLDDDLGRDTHLTVQTGGAWSFTAPDEEFNVAGTGARINKRGRLALAQRVGSIVIVASGRCPMGPGRAVALNLVGFEVRSLKDLSN